MEKKTLKTNKLQSILKCGILAISMASVLLASLLPSSAVTAEPLRNNTAAVLTPFTLYGDIEFNSTELHPSQPWVYGVDFTKAVDTAKFYDTATGAVEYNYHAYNRNDGYYEANEYTVNAFQGAYGGYDDIYGSLADGGLTGSSWAYNVIWNTDGSRIAESYDDSTWSGSHTKIIRAEGGGYYYSYEAYVDEMTSYIYLAPYFRADIADASSLDYAIAEYDITYIDTFGEIQTQTFGLDFNNIIVEGIVAEAVNYNPRSTFGGYLYSTVPTIAGEFTACRIPILPQEFLDTVLECGSRGDGIYILAASVEIVGYNRTDFEKYGYDADPLPLIPLVEIRTQSWYNGDWGSYYTTDPTDFFDRLGENVADEYYYIGYSDGYNEGINETWEDLNFTRFLGIAVGGFLDTPLFGAFSIGGMLAVVVGLALLIAFLKFFAGG